MRSPDNLSRNEYDSKPEYLIMNQIDPFEFEEYDLFNEKEFDKYVDDIKKTVRKSYEYNALISFLRENLNMSECSFYKNVSNKENFKIKIEVHHDPFTLHDICLIVINKRLFFHEDLELEMSAKEVMYLHYKNLIGLIPVSETVHELIGNGYIFVPTSYVYGKYKDFVKEYESFISPEQISTLSTIEEYTALYDHVKNTNVLNEKHVYIDASGSYNLPPVDSIKELLEQTVVRIREENRNKYFKSKNEFDNIKMECPFTIAESDALPKQLDLLERTPPTLKDRKLYDIL